MKHRFKTMVCKPQAGVTLVELVVSIVVISVGVAGILAVITRTTSSSADPVVLHQAIAVGEAYLEEILPKDFADPDQPETGGPGGEAGETRPTFDDVSDYHGLTDVGARDQTGAAIAGLGAYTVNVTVATDGGLPGIGAVNAKRIDVTVSGPFGSPVTISSFRTNYGP